MEEGVQVFYICGAGRSGSTLLDSILGQMEGFFSLGQFLGLPAISSLRSQHCACGKNLKECPFWSPFFEVFRKEMEELREEGNKDPYFARGRRLFELFRSTWLFLSGKGLAVDEAYKERQERILRFIAKRSGCFTLVDSSKKPLRLLALLALRGVDTHVIYIVRDGRGYMLSKRKDKSARKAGPFLSTLSWAYQNLVTLLVYTRVQPDHRILVSYEDFVRDPQREVSRIFQQFGINRTVPYDQVAYCDPATTHMPSGNRIRLDGKKKVEYKSDMDRLTAKDKLLYLLFGTWIKRLIASAKRRSIPIQPVRSSCS